MPRRRSNQKRQSSLTTLPSDIFPTCEEITSRAHALFVAGGRQVARMAEYRLDAEQELLEAGAKRALGWTRRKP